MPDRHAGQGPRRLAPDGIAGPAIFSLPALLPVEFHLTDNPFGLEVQHDLGQFCG